MQDASVTVEPGILYFGTPVVLISTLNEDGSANLAPMSSVFWLGWRSILGLNATSKTTENMIRTGECVLNLPSSKGVAAVDKLARLTGSNPVPPGKAARGYTYEKRKFEVAGFTAGQSERVSAPRALECPVQMEAIVAAKHNIMEDDPKTRGTVVTFELRILRVHAHPEILMTGVENRIDPDKWRPLILSFQKFYGLAPGQIHESTLSLIPEAAYRGPDIERARSEAPSQS
jgi:flavin reductase (DIM6/NTAB) family NADH-FMN oxidoreductase RutF